MSRCLRRERYHRMVGSCTSTPSFQLLSAPLLSGGLTPAKEVSPKRIMLALDPNLPGLSPGAVGVSG